MMFLFHIGAIKSALRPFHDLRSFCCFYSTLVRLKVPVYCTDVYPCAKFLFHIGAIKSISSDFLTKGTDLVSIPHWCD